MRFVLRLAAVVTIITLNLSLAKAIEVTGTTEQYLPLVQRLVSEKIQPVVDSLPEKQQFILNQVQVNIVDNMHPSAMAFALESTPPKILLNVRFLQGLSAYSEAYQLALHLKQPQFVEQYLQYYFSQTIAEHHAISVLRPYRWANLKAPGKQVLQQHQAVLEGVLLDVLLHEFGHHAEKAFYSRRANQHIVDQNERLADQWSAKIKAQYFTEINPLGRLISIAYIFEKERWSMLAQDHSVARMLPWVAGDLPEVCKGHDSEMAIQFCDRLEKDIQRYMSADIQQAYADRISQGEEYARFPLAQILMAKNNFVDACNYFNESLIYGQVARAAIYVGWCYQKGYLEPLPPDAQVLAMASRRGGTGYGYSDKRIRVGLF